MTNRRNTIQKDLVKNAVYEMKRHVTANEVYEFLKKEYPTIGKGTVYRNLDILSEEGALRKVEVPDGANRFDITLKNHYHVRCIKCGEVSDVDMEEIPDLMKRIHDTHGIDFLEYDISFKGIYCRWKANLFALYGSVSAGTVQRRKKDTGGNTSIGADASTAFHLWRRTGTIYKSSCEGLGTDTYFYIKGIKTA